MESNYKIPDSAFVNDDGTLSVKYLDAIED